jgi:probable rRNA maturation factor
MNAKSPIINFILLDKRWSGQAADLQNEISFALRKAAEILEKDFSAQEVSVVLVDDKEIQRLNKTFRHQDKPTNVLSFPSEQIEELGDIILAFETVMKEASQAAIPPLSHVLHLIIHGFLHLLGYDHEDDETAHQMEAMEIKILKDLNIVNPYEDK